MLSTRRGSGSWTRSCGLLVWVALIAIGAWGCGGDSEPGDGGYGGNGSGGDGSSCCSGDNRPDAIQAAINAFNYGAKIGLGLPVGASELKEIEAEYARLCPDCQAHVDEIGMRLQRWQSTQDRIRQIDKLPW